MDVFAVPPPVPAMAQLKREGSCWKPVVDCTWQNLKLLKQTLYSTRQASIVVCTAQHWVFGVWSMKLSSTYTPATQAHPLLVRQHIKHISHSTSTWPAHQPHQHISHTNTCGWRVGEEGGGCWFCRGADVVVWLTCSWKINATPTRQRDQHISATPTPATPTQSSHQRRTHQHQLPQYFSYTKHQTSATPNLSATNACKSAPTTQHRRPQWW